MFTVEPFGDAGGHKKLATVGVWSTVGHGQKTWSSVLGVEVFVGKFVAVNGLSAGTVSGGEIATLAHESWDDSVERTAFVAETWFAGAESSKVFNGFWYDFVVHLENDSAGWLTADGHVKKAGDRHFVSI